MLMRLRSLLVGLIVVATAAFVLGVALERNSEDEHHSQASNATAAESGQGEAAHAEDGEGEGADSSGETFDEESDARVLGVDLESTPFVVLAALASLGLALAVSVRPALALFLVAIAVAMAVFAVLDVREVVHQLDENREGLAVLAAGVAALHLGAAVVALTMSRRPEQPAA